ncbi:MAG: hypothetical protein P1V97_35170 [Planctomycetota bacterium]|nr:hypothetical protein [Planctomycetota bacterium]
MGKPSPSTGAPRPKRRLFERSAPEKKSGFLDLRTELFQERDADGKVIAEKALEFVLPKKLSDNTIAVALIRRSGDEYFIGLDDDDLPAAQCFTGNSQILVTPAWRLPRSLRSMTPARRWIRGRLENEYGLTLGQAWELGGYFHPSPGVTPEIVFPLAVEVTDEDDFGRDLVWVEIGDAIKNRAKINDGHLTTVLLRSAHALGLLGKSDD